MVGVGANPAVLVACTSVLCWRRRAGGIRVRVAGLVSSGVGLLREQEIMRADPLVGDVVGKAHGKRGSESQDAEVAVLGVGLDQELAMLGGGRAAAVRAEYER